MNFAREWYSCRLSIYIIYRARLLMQYRYFSHDVSILGIDLFCPIWSLYPQLLFCLSPNLFLLRSIGISVFVGYCFFPSNENAYSLWILEEMKIGVCEVILLDWSDPNFLCLCFVFRTQSDHFIIITSTIKSFVFLLFIRILLLFYNMYLIQI